ncbi:LuxR C-terminal-related transcriptional regulator [Streptomyces sp. NPDC020490]|uniref:LuxR C-terminal-related transcriptional regulator n=1 Tax=Streptomyces sp. NPDC020490 TaxID=3365078 RepID=UPI0037AEFFDC
MNITKTESPRPRARLADDQQSLVTEPRLTLLHDDVRDDGVRDAMARVPLLSERELDVFRLLGKGASNRSIATRLGITERTTKAHVAQILSKLGVESRLQAGIAGFAWEIAGGGRDAPR